MMDMDFVNDPIDTGLIFDPNGFHGLAINDWLSNLGTSFTDWVDSWSSHSGFSNDVIVGFRLYANQPVEIDARNFAADVLARLEDKGVVKKGNKG